MNKTIQFGHPLSSRNSGESSPKVEVVKARPMFVGRAAESPAKHVEMMPLSEILAEKCQGSWAGERLSLLWALDVDEFGFVMACPGLSIGNAREVSLIKTIRRRFCKVSVG